MHIYSKGSYSYVYKAKLLQLNLNIREFCQHSPTISNEKAVAFLCKALNIPELDSEMICRKMNQILLHSDGTMSLKAKQEQILSLSL